MKFKLNEYHHNTSDEEFIEDIRKTATKRLNKDTLIGAENDEHGYYHSSTLTKRLASWKTVLEKSGLKTKGHNFKFSYSNEYVVDDLRE